jgi:nitrite reductase/ring-hydroxylating ferredoxin subunit
LQSFNTKPGDPQRLARTIIVDRVENLPAGRCATIELPNGDELALYNVSGEFYATENCCPHKGAPLAEGSLCGHIIECGWHGWQFDVRSGECLTAGDRLETYGVIIEDGVIKIEV